MSKPAAFTCKNLHEVAQAVVSLACLIRDEAWIAEQRQARHLTALQRLQALASTSLENHASDSFTHQLLTYIASTPYPHAERPKLTVVRSE